MIAIIAQQVIPGAEELCTDVLDDGVDLVVRVKGEALQDGGAEGAAGGLGAGRRVVDAGEVASGVAAVGIFAIADADAGVQEGGAEGVEDGGDAAGLVMMRRLVRVEELSVGPEQDVLVTSRIR